MSCRKELEDAFKLFDREGDGQIEAQELSNLLWSLGLQPSREEVEDLLIEMDADRFLDFIVLIPPNLIKIVLLIGDCYQDKGSLLIGKHVNSYSI